MSIQDVAEAVQSVLFLQRRAAEIGVSIDFRMEKRDSYSPEMLAAVISRPGCTPDVFFSFAEASAFMHGLDVAARMLRDKTVEDGPDNEKGRQV